MCVCVCVCVTQVSGEVPELMDLVLHMLHRECCFAVPCSFARTDPASKTELTPIQHKRLLGYKEIEDPNKPGETNVRYLYFVPPVHLRFAFPACADAVLRYACACARKTLCVCACVCVCV